MGGSSRYRSRRASGRHLARATGLKPLAYAALALAYGQVVLGAVVRITGSGMGCGDHWPKCHGYWFPPLDRLDLIIEVSHRYVAATLTLVVIALVVTAWRGRAARAAEGGTEVLRPALAALALVVAAALLGAATVKLDLHAGAVVTHLALAMALIAALALAAVRARASSSPRTLRASSRTVGASTAAAGIAFVTVIMGGVTANVAGAAAACAGFPHCRAVREGGMPLFIQIGHRLLAFALLLHLFGMLLAARKRSEPSVTVAWSRIAFGVVLAQILVAAMMVETGLPLQLRILHQALGTLVWLSVFVFAAVAREGGRA